MENNKLTCPICGKPTFAYFGNPRKDGLCAEHGKLEHEHKIEQCPKCKAWHDAGQDCNCGTQKPQKSQNNIFKTTQLENEKFTEQKENKCLLCDKDSGKYLFCKDCFNTYHGKTLLLKITCDKDQKLELLNESYEGVYTCKDGHIVKSKSERDIDNYLFDHKIAHAYEKSLVIGNEIFKPDFYLKDEDVYIEHWGYDESNKEYTKRKEYKLPKYKEAKITLIQTNEKDMQDVEASLQLKLKNYKKNEINEE